MPFCENFALDNFVGRPIVDNCLPGEVLLALWAFEVAFCIILLNPVRVTFYQRTRTFFFVLVEQCAAFRATHFNGENLYLFIHCYLPAKLLFMALNSGGHTPAQALQEMQFSLIVAVIRLLSPSFNIIALNAQLA